jgi:hypothetical protein
MKRLLIPALLVLGVLAGCASPDSRIKDNPGAFSQLPPDQQAMVKQGQIGLGMPEGAVEIAMGKPDRVSERVDASGTQKIWHYTDVDTYDAVGPAYPWSPWGGFHRHYYGPFYYPPGAYAVYPVATETDRIRVVFKDGKVVAVERET